MEPRRISAPSMTIGRAFQCPQLHVSDTGFQTDGLHRRDVLVHALAVNLNEDFEVDLAILTGFFQQLLQLIAVDRFAVGHNVALLIQTDTYLPDAGRRIRHIGRGRSWACARQENGFLRFDRDGRVLDGDLRRHGPATFRW